MKRVLTYPFGYCLGLLTILILGLSHADPAQAQMAPDESTLVVAVSEGPTELDPDFGESSIKGNILRQIFDLPTWYDDQGVLQSSIFESWEILNEGRTWRFKIVEGAEFVSGTPINAETIKFTFDRMIDPDILAAGSNNQFPSRVGLTGVEVVDEYTLDINTEEPNILVPLRLYVVYLLDPSFYADAPLSETASHTAASGPYELVEFVPDDHIILERNENYWRGPADIERIVFRIVPERSSRIAMLETGEVDIALDLATDDIPILQDIPNVNAAVIEGARRVGLVFNQQKPYFQDKRVRQAFNYAINWDDIKNALLSGIGDRATTYRGTDFCANPELSPYPYDPERAMELLEAANFPMDQPLTIDVSSAYGYRVQVVQAIAAQLEDLGLEVEVNVLDNSVYRQRVFGRDFSDMIEVGLGGRGVPTQDAQVFLADAAWNPSSWQDEQWQEFDSILSEMSSNFDSDARCAMTKELEAIAYDAAPWLFTHHELIVAGVHQRVDWMPRLDDHLYFYNASWADE